MENDIRVRFAPSPTGALHIGGVRTALFNYLFAKKNGGKMILRIEDTDQSRYVEGAETYIKEALGWLGLKMDEGPDEGGESGPYRQSERKALYHQYAMQLVNEDKAYYAFDTPEELDAMREKLKAAKVDNQQYNSITRTTMKNSITLSADEVKARLDSGEPYVIRLKVPTKEDIRLNDMVRGWVKVHSTAIDDKILMKSDGMPTYHLANIVDDHLMGITHVIRGEEWLPSAPLHVLLYQFLGWEESMPQFAHLPLILKPSGQGKLSKRDADKHGFPIFPINWQDPESGELSTGFREEGYLPETVINFLALLGWNPGTDQEIFSMDELIEAFSIDRIGKAGTQFDIEKAKWYNQQYIKEKPSNELAGFLQQELKKESIACSDEKAAQIANLLRERITFPHELWSSGKYLFCAPKEFDQKVVKKRWTEEAVTILTGYQDALQNVTNLDAEQARASLNEVLERNDTVIGRVMQAVRVAITGLGSGPDLMEIIEIIGKEETIKRINYALDTLNEYVKA
ncbi:glutamate--tRNA ligase [Fulvivirgaceae bacterium BMA10]|uniref:Glutamate--tRNA ligase n=1 Tax=Splendidivirga corallicola TaxID=3051826 RepID=A0ABT8KUQ9_9BACT|nr:glutamate--tRNA ligase [Fulvivirgaceae bacterium BMA10]